MPLPKRNPDTGPRVKAPAGEEALLLAEAGRPLETLLASGGDRRLALRERDQKNAYGCTPFPRSALLDFGSSTASSISAQAYAKAQAAQAVFWRDASRIGVARAFDDRMDAARRRLRSHLSTGGAEIVFSPSGTDAQLQALFLVKALLGAPLVTIIVGADQTGSGTAHTARGQHFSDRTALGVAVEKGAPIPGLSDQVTTIAIPFCDDRGRLRSSDEMDEAVRQAAADAIGRGEKVLLQIMDASKLGWRAPSEACVDAIAAMWPHDIRVVVDACQMRIGRGPLRNYLDRGFFVLATGSKFFTGPAFSGALLVPPAHTGAVDAIADPPRSLGSYSTRFDWPRRWTALRNSLSSRPNYGQWLRWEATLEEMNAYFAVPTSFRHSVLESFAVRVPAMIAETRNLKLLSERGGVAEAGRDDEFGNGTIFSFVPQRGEEALTLERCVGVYRAMGQDLSGLLPSDAPLAARRTAALMSQIGQPVALRHRPAAVLRLSASARLVSLCWVSAAATLADAMAPMLADIAAVIGKLDWLIEHPELCENPPE
jgi:hypothetical protein